MGVIWRIPQIQKCGQPIILSTGGRKEKKTLIKWCGTKSYHQAKDGKNERKNLLLRWWSLFKSPKRVRSVVFRQTINRKRQKDVKRLGSWFPCYHYLVCMPHLILPEYVRCHFVDNILASLLMRYAEYLKCKALSIEAINGVKEARSSSTSPWYLAFFASAALFEVASWVRLACC